MKILIKISLLLFICSGINPVYASSLSPKHKTALKIECKQAIEDGLFISKNKCYAEKTILIDQYGYAWTDKLNDKTLARKIQLQCHILIDDGLFKYNQCIETKVNLALGIVREKPLQPPLEYVSTETDEEEVDVKVEVIESTNTSINTVYSKLKKSVMLIRLIPAKTDWSDKEIQNSLKEVSTCSAVSIGKNLFATNAHCILIDEDNVYMSKQKISDFICILPIDKEIPDGDTWEAYFNGCNWAHVVGIDAHSDQAIISISEPKESFFAPPVNIRESNKVEIFEDIYTLGNPKGNIGIITQGKITSIANHTIHGLYEKAAKIFTIDAIIEGGNSGGGLFDLNGNLLGITSAGDPERMGKKDIRQFNYAIVIDEFLNLLD